MSTPIRHTKQQGRSPGSMLCFPPKTQGQPGERTKAAAIVFRDPTILMRWSSGSPGNVEATDGINVDSTKSPDLAAQEYVKILSYPPALI